MCSCGWLEWKKATVKEQRQRTAHATINKLEMLNEWQFGAMTVLHMRAWVCVCVYECLEKMHKCTKKCIFKENAHCT